MKAYVSFIAFQDLSVTKNRNFKRHVIIDGKNENGLNYPYLLY